MASATQWEVVVKSKKQKTPARPLSKIQKKRIVEKMPRIESNAPVKEDKTIYSAFLEKEQQAVDQGNAASARQSNGPGVINSSKKTTAQKKKKSEQDLKKHEKIVLDAAIAQIDHRELENTLSQSQLRFPDNQDVWLKDLASYLNFKLEKVKDVDNTFKGKPQGYPLELLPASCQKILNSVVKKFSNQALDNLFFYFVQTVLAETSKDQSTIGYKIFLQLLAHHKPDIAIGKINQYLDLLKTHQNRPSNCLAILWAAGQCGFKDFKCGLRVWLELMLPALEVRQIASYPVEYLEQLVSSHKKVDSAYGIITLKEYFKVLDVVFSPSFNLSNDLKKRLISLYPHIRELAHGEAPYHNLRTFFPSYLARFNTSSNQILKNEILECLVKCLTVDKQSFSVWCQLYVKHLTASGHLLEHINHEWSKLTAHFDKKLLQETLRSFSVTNDEIEAQNSGNREGLALCQAATKELTTKIARDSFPWGQVLFFLVLVLASVVVYDVSSSQNFRASRTARFLEHYGVLALLEQAWKGISRFLTAVAEWLNAKFPVYFAYARETFGPFLSVLWDSLQDFMITAELTTRPHRAWILERAVDFRHWVYELSPSTWEWCYSTLILAWSVGNDYTLWIWNHSVHLTHGVYKWLTVYLFSISKESLQNTFREVLSHLQTFLEFLWTWFNTNVLALFK